MTYQKINPDIVQTWMIHADLIGGLTARLIGIKNIFGCPPLCAYCGKVKWPTIFILKINALLYFIPKNHLLC